MPRGKSKGKPVTIKKGADADAWAGAVVQTLKYALVSKKMRAYDIKTLRELSRSTKELSTAVDYQLALRLELLAKSK